VFGVAESWLAANLRPAWLPAGDGPPGLSAGFEDLSVERGSRRLHTSPAAELCSDISPSGRTSTLPYYIQPISSRRSPLLSLPALHCAHTHTNHTKPNHTTPLHSTHTTLPRPILAALRTSPADEADERATTLSLACFLPCSSSPPSNMLLPL
jgi:hypothetical protein